VVESPDGGFVCTYTAFDGKVGALFVATSSDLRHWQKHGPAFAATPYVRLPTKSGAVLTELRGGRLVAARRDGKYWMYWGEGTIYAATSDDLIRWAPLQIGATPDRYLSWTPAGGADAADGRWGAERVPGPMALRPIAGPRRGRFDSLLAEPGPPAVLTEAGVVLIYNGANHPRVGEPGTPGFAYQPGQLLLDAADPSAVIGRTLSPFLRIDPAEAKGQVGNVCFAEGLVAWKDQLWLYVGLADSRLGVCVAPMKLGPGQAVATSE
jgi:predicted GH43/DUF377 family glycosyl hydrolase